MADEKQAQMTQSPIDELRVGILQTAPKFGEVESNIRRIEELKGQLEGVDIILTPELAINGFGFGADLDYRPLHLGDNRLASLLSSRTPIGLGFAAESELRLPYNAYAIAGDGEHRVQHKIHPVSYAPWNEHLSFESGDAVVSTQIQGARCATVICNDMWHPSIPWLAAQTGAEVLIVPVASIEGANADLVQRTWQVILEHTALLLQCYVVFINRCGTDSGATFWGRSRVVGPDGKILVQAGATEETLQATLDLKALRALRAQSPVLAESRHDVVVNGLNGQTASSRNKKGSTSSV
ncbi:nitrilase-related carbon-nitrogen hydrolase [Paeniglutamicibacter sulfureus]|uniref:carbon-nitrogen hydrolase family protein n=1 Tax=Paeniglutamicibacter sulfureus TaxID=43666 RepID=UPI0026666CFA|nr:nitrilase-related carbon-nitrogen hydrolase [Paeniglutamicibacter sulfureus]MDO2934207.1 nitrilase-related carbon-nitrogen hydrolase [Paeniglutamicibacter sulfureus]